MYHYQLHLLPQPPTQTTPCCHRQEPWPFPTDPYHRALLCSLHSSSSRLSHLDMGETSLAYRTPRSTTYAMPWQTCSVCPRYPFPCQLLLDPPSLWTLYPRASHITMSHASHLPSPRSHRHVPIRQTARTLTSGPTSETSKTQRTPSTVGWPERATSRR
jgi:hypothetical protein